MLAKNGRGVGTTVQTAEIDDLAVSTAKIAAGAVTTAKLDSAAVTNAVVSGSAAIAYSKLNLASSIVNADISNSAAIALSKLSTSGFSANQVVSYNGSAFAAADPAGAWTVLGGANLGGGAATSIAVSSIAAYDMLMLIAFVKATSASTAIAIQFNDSGGTAYQTKRLVNGSIANASGNAYFIPAGDTETPTDPMMLSMIIGNTQAQNKTIIGSVGNYSYNIHFTGQWNDTSNQVNKIKIMTDTANTYTTATWMRVFGRNK